MDKNAKIYVAGHRGMVGSAIVRNLQVKGYTNIVTRTHQELDLINQAAVDQFFADEKPDYVFLAAAKVGGIQANNIYRADFIYQNMMIEANIVHATHKANINHLLFLGSSCIYPRDCPQPIKEEFLLTGPLEQTNEPYAIAKIAGLKLCESYNRQYGRKYVSVMPTNLYGPNDNYDLNNSHVLPALIRKVHLSKLAGKGDLPGIEADEQRFGKIPDDFKACLVSACQKKQTPDLVVWGTGAPRREFLYVDDMADACVFLMESQVSEGVYNVGSGSDLTIGELASIVMSVIGVKGQPVFDTTKPDGTLRKLLDVSALANKGWQFSTTLTDGIVSAYADYLNNAKG